jgi:hypothetical protein
MSVAPETAPLTIAGHSIAVQDRAGGLLNLRIALHGESFVALARALAKLAGVRVTSGPEAAGRERCCVVHCPGFKMVVSSPPEEDADFALALVSRTPQAALVVMSDLGAVLERLMIEPPPIAEVVARGKAGWRASTKTSSSLSRSSLQQGKPLARKTALTRKTPLRRGRGPSSR